MAPSIYYQHTPEKLHFYQVNHARLEVYAKLLNRYDSSAGYKSFVISCDAVVSMSPFASQHACVAARNLYIFLLRELRYLAADLLFM